MDITLEAEDIVEDVSNDRDQKIVSRLLAAQDVRGPVKKHP